MGVRTYLILILCRYVYIYIYIIKFYNYLNVLNILISLFFVLNTKLI